VVSDFDHQQAVFIEVRCCLAQDDAHRIQAVFAACQREPRFMPVFARKFAHRVGVYVRWIGDDQVIAFGRDR